LKATALWALCRSIDPPSAIPALIRVLQESKSHDLQVRAEEALLAFGAAVVDPVTELLKSSDELVRRSAIRILQRIRPRPEKAIPELKKIADNEKDQLAKPARQALDIIAKVPRARPQLPD
jgi:HEAT repeat protein